MSKRTTFITLIGITALLVALGIFFFASQKRHFVESGLSFLICFLNFFFAILFF